MGSEKKIADEETQNGIAKELQFFVITCLEGSLIGLGTISRPFCAELDVLKHVSKFELQILGRTHNEKGWNFGDEDSGDAPRILKFKNSECIPEIPIPATQPLFYYAGIRRLLGDL